MGVTFVTAIDTDAGKTIATGLLARHLLKSGVRAITAKLAQTGSEGVSGDIALHRKLMGMELLAEDLAGQTCPYLFPFPASPHLAAKLSGVRIDPALIRSAVEKLSQNYDEVVVEGVGGWLVPLTPLMTTADLVAEAGWSVVLVTSPRLGSINHTLLTLEAIKNRGVRLLGGIYNLHASDDPSIVADSLEYLSGAFHPAPLVEMPPGADPEYPPEIDFSALFMGSR